MGSETTPYQDTFFESSSLLFWEGQTSKRIAESAFKEGLDCHVFIHKIRRSVYTYYGRAVVLREQINPVGIPSRFVLYLPEYESMNPKQQMHDEVIADIEASYFTEPTERQNLQTIRTKQATYRQKVITLWHGRCAVTGVDEEKWLIASHIKPWRESTDSERVDPKNSLLLIEQGELVAICIIIIVNHLVESRELYHLFRFLHWEDNRRLHSREDCGNTPVDHTSERNSAFSYNLICFFNVRPLLRNVNLFQ